MTRGEHEAVAQGPRRVGGIEAQPAVPELEDRARDAAVNMMEFFADESCGQCTPCRVGTEKAAGLMREARWDKPLLADLSQAMMDASICGLGQAAPNPIACVVKYFPQEVE